LIQLLPSRINNNRGLARESPMDRLDAMRLFARIVERRSFSQAARDLQIPRPTVTHAIQQLEARLGARLLERTTRQVTPTRDGLVYYERCVRLLADADEAESLFRTAAPRGPLRVDLQGTLARVFVLPALPDFLARYPDVRLRLSEGDRMVDLIREGVDCVLRAGELTDSSLIGRRVASFEQVTCASPAYLDAFGVPRTLDDLASHRMIGYLSSASGRPYPLEFRDGGETRLVAPETSITVTGAEIYTACTLAGLGLVQSSVKNSQASDRACVLAHGKYSYLPVRAGCGCLFRQIDPRHRP
jgi:DNA-binding transcriptional LysR family regulator